MRDILKLLRPKHWIKNGLIFLPVIFRGSTLWKDYVLSFYGFLFFSLLASAVYIINDIRDVEKDRRHEVKKNRPIASGRVSTQTAAVLAVALSAGAVAGNILVSERKLLSTICLLVYLAMNLLYSFGLKDRPIIDVVILAAGFVIRVLYGSALTAITASPMLVLTVMSFALYLGLGKRRNEKRKIGNDTREVLLRYTDEFLDKNMYMCLVCGIVFYAIWSMSIGGLAVYTVIVVIIICMRYNLILENDSYGDPVDVVSSDKVLLGLVFLFVLMLMATLYIV